MPAARRPTASTGGGRLAVALAVRAEPDAAEQRPRRLHVVADSKADLMVERNTRPRRVRIVVTLVGAALVALVVLAGFAAVAMHARLAKDQLRLDQQKTAVETEARAYERLRVEVAELESPDRIVALATSLGMRNPSDVRFLAATTSPPASSARAVTSGPSLPTTAR